MIIKKRVLLPISDEEYLQEIKDIDEAIKIALETRKFGHCPKFCVSRNWIRL